MNRRPPGLLLSTAIDGFLQYKTAEGLSRNTTSNYSQRLSKWLEYTGDVPVAEIGSHKIQAFLACLRTDYRPNRVNGDTSPLAPKTIRNFYVAISAFYTWACVEFEIPSPMGRIKPPKFQVAPVEPFSKDEVVLVLKEAKYCRESVPSDRRRFAARRPTARRDEAIILTLFDTGLRASELCSLKVGDYEYKTGRLEVKHGAAGGAKGGKGRIVLVGKSARRSIWRYLAEREDGKDYEASLFLAANNRPMTKSALRRLVARLGEKSGICTTYVQRHCLLESVVESLAEPA